MTDIAQAVNAYIAEKTGITGITNDAFYSDGSEGVISRHDPSTAKETQYIDGSAEGVLNLAYYARYMNAKTARETLNGIINALDNQTVETETLTIYVSAETLPQFVATNEKGMTLYTAGVSARFERNAL